MRVQWSLNLDQLKTAQQSWQAIFSQLPENVTGPNNIPVPKVALSQLFSECVRLMDKVCVSDDTDPAIVPIYQPGVLNSITQIQQFINTARSHGVPWAQQNSSQLHSNLWNLKTSLLWLAPLKETLGDIAILRGKNVAQNAAIVESLVKKLNETEAVVTEDLQKISTTKTEVDNILETVKKHEREASGANNNALASANNAATEKQKVDDFVKSLSSAEEQKSKLFEEFEKQRDQVNNLLEGANKVGLARSFSDRRKSMKWALLGWGFVFILSICVMAYFGWYEINELWQVIAKEQNPGTAELFAILAKLPLFGPVIWLAWFCARQYGHSLRLREDYAFKEATAMAYVGYRREMGEDTDMLKMLQETAIRNFGANPIRLFGRPEPASPIHDLLDKALEKGALDKLMDIMKVISFSGKG